jgi:O-antigen ligase
MNTQQRSTVGFLLTVPLLVGLSAFEFEIDGTISTTGMIWMLQFLGAVILLPLATTNAGDTRSIRWWSPWIIWFGWVWLSVTWSDDVGARNLQEAVQLSMPLLIGLLASRSVGTREDLARLLSAFRWAVIPLVLYGLIYVTKVADQDWMEQHARATALSAVFLGCVFLAELPSRIVLPLVGWALCLMVTVFTESRMATVALLAIPIFHPCFRSKLWNVAMACAAAAAGVGLFNTQVFQERFFPFTGKGTLQDVLEGSFISQGRFEAWPLILDEAWKRPVLGYGVGSAYEFVPTVWRDMHYAHNDYLRIGFELGWAGLALFAVAMLWQLLGLGLRLGRAEGTLRTAYAAAWLGFWGLLITSMSDNTIVYNAFYTNPLFVVLGAAYGVAIAESPRVVADKILPQSRRRELSLRNRRTSYTT